METNFEHLFDVNCELLFLVWPMSHLLTDKLHCS